MKNIFMCLLAVLLLFSYNSIEGYENYEEITSIEYLLNERISIMNDFLYGSKEEKDIESLNVKLNAIETEALLCNDLDILYKVIDNPTDYELAKSVKVDKINSLEKKGKNIYINVDLNWSMSGYDGEFTLVKNYDMKCIQKEDKIYLSSLVYNE